MSYSATPRRALHGAKKPILKSYPLYDSICGAFLIGTLAETGKGWVAVSREGLGRRGGRGCGGSPEPGGGTTVALITVGVTPSYMCVKTTRRHACVHSYTCTHPRVYFTGEVRITVAGGTYVSSYGAL